MKENCPAYYAMVLGARYERANLQRNFARMMQIENELARLERDNPDMWVSSFVARGRNFISRARGNSTEYAA